MKEYDFKVGDRVKANPLFKGYARPFEKGTITDMGSINSHSDGYIYKFARITYFEGKKKKVSAFMLSSLVPIVENLNANTKTL